MGRGPAAAGGLGVRVQLDGPRARADQPPPAGTEGRGWEATKLGYKMYGRWTEIPPDPNNHHTTPQFWHCCLAWLFYAYIVQGRTAAALERVVRERVIWYWLGAVTVAAGISAVCFYAPPRSPLHRAEVGYPCSCGCPQNTSDGSDRLIPTMHQFPTIFQLPWTASTTAASLLAVLALYVKTMYHWRRGNATPSSSSSTTSAPACKAAAATTTTASTIPPPPASPISSAALRRPLWRLVVLLGFFLAIGTWALVNECRAAATALGGERGPRSTGDMPNILLSIVDALVLGGVLSCIYPSCLQSGSRQRRKQQRALNRRRQQLLMDQQRRRGAAVAERKGGSHGTGTGAGAGVGMGLKLPSMSLLRKRSMGSGSLNSSGVALRPRGRLDRQLQIFASTFNAGSTKGSCAALGPVEAWVPRGFDLYVIVSLYSGPGGICSMLATPDPHTTY